MLFCLWLLWWLWLWLWFLLLLFIVVIGFRKDDSIRFYSIPFDSIPLESQTQRRCC